MKSKRAPWIAAGMFLLAGAAQFGLVFFNHTPDLDPEHNVRNLRLISGGLSVLGSVLLLFQSAKEKRP